MGSNPTSGSFGLRWFLQRLRRGFRICKDRSASEIRIDLGVFEENLEEHGEVAGISG